MESLDIEVLVRKNFECLIKLSGLKKGDVEKKIGVCPGYFSRTKHCMNLNVAFKLAQVMNVSLDDMCSKNFYKKLLLEELEMKKAEIEKQIKEVENA